MQTTELADLIDRAAEAVGSKAQLARQLGTTPQRLNDWRSGYVTCPVEYVALIADAANLPADQWVARAVLWRSAGKKTEAALQKALGKCLRATGAVLGLGFGAVVVDAIRHSTMYRKVKLRRAF